jgi:hypothetical protein
VTIPASPGRFSASCPGGVLVRSSKQPLLDAARALLDLGEPPETVLTTRHQGSAIVAQRSTVGEAAKWTINGRDRGGLRRELWKPHPRAAQNADCSEGGGGDFERGGEGRGILPPEAPTAFSGAPRHPADDFAPRAKRARE